MTIMRYSVTAQSSYQIFSYKRWRLRASTILLEMVGREGGGGERGGEGKGD